MKKPALSPMPRFASEMPPVARPTVPVHPDIVDDYTQTGGLFRLFTTDQQERLIKNVAAAMEGASEEIIHHQLVYLHLADPRYAEGVARVLKITKVACCGSSPFFAPDSGPRPSKIARVPRASLI